MSVMSEQEITPNKIYSVQEVAEIIGVTDRHIIRLIDEGCFAGTYRKTLAAKSPYQIPGSAVLTFLEQRKNL